MAERDKDMDYDQPRFVSDLIDDLTARINDPFFEGGAR